MTEKNPVTPEEIETPAAPETATESPAAEAGPENVPPVENPESARAEAGETADAAFESPETAEIRALKARVERLEAELAERNDRLLRTMAEFDNFKKRTAREKESAVAFIRAQTVGTLLPCCDGLERALAADASSPDYAKGLEISLRQLMEGFKKLGLEEIDPLGEPFDPNLHEAVMHVQDDALGENTVAEVLRKGYKIGDAILRPAMVKVAN